MLRPGSWLPRLHEIRRSVTNSVRSHYDRRDLPRRVELTGNVAWAWFSCVGLVARSDFLVTRDFDAFGDATLFGVTALCSCSVSMMRAIVLTVQLSPPDRKVLLLPDRKARSSSGLWPCRRATLGAVDERE